MRPSAKQLIEGIDWSLQTRVAPVTDDKWAASTLRSVHCLLQHLAVRVEEEGRLLHDDNLDARRVLEEVCSCLAAETSWTATAAEVTGALERSRRAADEFPTTTALTGERDVLRGTIDELVRALHRPASAAPGGPEAAALALLDGYLQRSLQREQPLFMPAFLSSTF